MEEDKPDIKKYGLEGLEEFYGNVDWFTRNTTKRSFKELTKLISNEEETYCVYSVDYEEDTGLMLLTDQRIIFASRKKSQVPTIVEFAFTDLTNAILDKGVLVSSIRLTTSFQDKVFTQITHSEAKDIEERALYKIAQRKSQPELHSAQNALLDKLFDANQGWTFTSDQILVERKDSFEGKNQYLLTTQGQEFLVFQTDEEYRNLLNNKDVKGSGLSTIILSHELNGLSRNQIESIESDLGQKLTSSTIIRGSGVVISSSIPVVRGIAINALRQQLIASTIVLLQRKVELDSLLQTASTHNIDEQEVVLANQQRSKFGFNELAAFIGSVAEIASLVAGDDE